MHISKVMLSGQYMGHMRSFAAGLYLEPESSTEREVLQKMIDKQQASVHSYTPFKVLVLVPLDIDVTTAT